MILDINNFRQKFIQDGYPYWRVYKGRNAGKDSLVIAVNTSVGNMEESWNLLQQALSLYPYGSVTVVAKSSPHAKDGIQSWVEWGQQPTPTGQPAIAGFNGPATSISGIEQMWNFSQSMFNSQVAPMIEGIKKDNEIQRLKERIEALESEQPLTAKEKLIEGIADNVPTILQTIMGLLKPGQQLQPAIGTLGQQQPEDQVNGEGNIDLNVIFNVAQDLSETFPEYDVNVLLINLAKFCKGNKDQATMVIKMIMQQ